MKISVSISTIWVVTYLFTIGFADIGGWALFWALFIWPVYVGQALHLLLARAPS